MSAQSLLENPPSSLKPVLDLLNAIAAERKDGLCRVSEILTLDPTVSRFLQEGENMPAADSFANLLNGVSAIIKESKVERIITDWPFEHFWGEPHEPEHSKLLAFFINPENHGEGISLLKELLNVCGKSNLTVDGRCKVTNEKNKIDIVVKRQAQDNEPKNGYNNYAIIIENKIYGAKNQTRPEGSGLKGQLHDYVETLYDEDRSNFDYKYIHVFYLPLRTDKDPNPEDRAAVIEKTRKNADDKEGNYKKITFEKEILGWLKKVTDKTSDAIKNEGMRDNLTHYKNLIAFLINKYKEISMNKQIFDKLSGLEKEGEAIPSLNDALRARDALNELVQCLQIYHSLEMVRKVMQAECEREFPYDGAIGIGAKALGGEGVFWFVYDYKDDREWYFAYESYGDNSQCPEAFDQNVSWNGEKRVFFKPAGELIEGGNFASPELSQPIAEKASEIILEWRARFTKH